MQTFLPFPDFARSAACLDRQRLGKQRLEAKQILQANLQGPTVLKLNVVGASPEWGPVPTSLPDGYRIAATGWYNHVVVRMWRGHELQLARYGMAICSEWVRRGYEDAQFEFFADTAESLMERGTSDERPPWLTEAMCSCHRAALLGKDFAHYSQFGWGEIPTDGYVWPEESK